MTRRHAVWDSPIGPVTAVEDDGELVGLAMDADNWRAPGGGNGDRDDRALPALQEQLAAYWDRKLTRFDVPLRLAGSPFQNRVWAALRRIPYGETRSYQAVANELGQPTATRAVGLANGRNPIGIVVPCHRVIGSNGRLTGYAGGLERKQFLLALESPAPTLPIPQAGGD